MPCPYGGRGGRPIRGDVLQTPVQNPPMRHAPMRNPPRRNPPRRDAPMRKLPAEATGRSAPATPPASSLQSPAYAPGARQLRRPSRQASQHAPPPLPSPTRSRKGVRAAPMRIMTSACLKRPVPTFDGFRMRDGSGCFYTKRKGVDFHLASPCLLLRQPHPGRLPSPALC